MMRRATVVLLAPLAIAVAVARPTAREPQAGSARAGEDSATALLIRRRIEERSHRPGRAADGVRAFYGRRAYAAAWSTPGGLLPEADRLREALAMAPADGLDPSDYELFRADAIIRSIGPIPAVGGALSAPRRAELDILLTETFLTLGSDLLRGRVDPRAVHPSWTLPRRDRDLVSLLEEALRGNAVGPTLASLAPMGADYRALKEALGHYRRIEAAGGWGTIARRGALKPGDDSPEVAVVRSRLQTEVAVPLGASPTRYDEGLAGAVRDFQRRRGLEDDGVIGEATREALNVPVGARIRQLELSLERLRWLPDELGRRHIRVSIPAFELVVVDEGRVRLAMKIIGGRPDWRTPIFSSEMTSVVLSPYWNIPASIAAREVIPDARRDPGYLERNEIRVVAGHGAGERVVSPRSLDWSRFDPRGSTFRLRQDPGPANPLGGVKFVFPNRYNVYLHDTPSRQLFARAERAYSHGCMRIDKPMELAEYLLGPSGWDREEMEAVIARRSERTVALPDGIPVHILYQTAWVDAQGIAQFRRDLYGHDATLTRLLEGRTRLAQAATECGTVAG